MAACCTYHRPTYFSQLLNRSHTKKCLSLNEKILKNFLERVQENGPASRKKGVTERIIGKGRREREEIVKWNQMTALRFQTGERHQTSLASLRGIAEAGLKL